MNDIENQINTLIYTAVSSMYPNAKFESELNLSPSVFPCVCVEMIEAATRKSSLDSSTVEKYTNVTFEINIFTNDATGKKQAAKKIFGLIDSVMFRMGFERITYVPNGLDQGTKYRLLVRYQGAVDNLNRIYRR